MRSLRTRIGFASLAVAGAVALAVLAPGASASAHDALVSSNPAAGATVATDPGSAALTFSEALLVVGNDTSGFAVQVADAAGLHYESGCAAVSGSIVSTPVALGGAGTYTVFWRVVSADGHPTSGQYDFVFQPGAGAKAATGVTPAPACGAAWAGSAPTATPAPAPAPAATTASPASTAPAAAPIATATAGPVTGGLQTPPSGLPWPLVLLFVIVAVGVVATVILLVIRRSRSGGYGSP